MTDGSGTLPRALSARAVMFRFVVGFLDIVGFLAICYAIFVLVYIAVEQPFT